MRRLCTFPGEGRGPVVEQPLASGARCYIDQRDWAPAFAGEAIVVEVLDPPYKEFFI